MQQVSTSDSVATFLEMQESGKYNPDFVAMGLERIHYHQPQSTQEAIKALSPAEKEQAVEMIQSVYDSWGIPNLEKSFTVE